MTTLASAAALLGSAPAARSNPADVNWSNLFGNPGLTGYVAATANWNGTLVVGGSITNAEGVTVKHVVTWNGAHFAQLGAGFNGEVTSLAVVGSTLYATGYFDSSGTTALPHLARWSGSAWVRVGVGGPDNPDGVNVVADGATLLLLGNFDTVSSPPVAAARIARWNGSTWSSVGTFPGSGKPTCAARVGTILYVGEDGKGNSLLAYNGANWTVVNGIGGQVRALASYNSRLYAAGSFSAYVDQNTNAQNLASWDGAGWHDLAGVVPDGSVNVLVVDNAKLLVAGDFTNTPGPRYARFDGTSWTPGTSGLETSNGNLNTCTRVGTNLFFAGYFQSVYDYSLGHQTYSLNIAREDATGFHAMGVGQGLDSEVWDLAVLNNRLIATGTFSNSNDGTGLGRIAAWDGGHWSPLGTGLFDTFGSPAGYVLGTWTNQVIVGGYFTKGGAVASQNIAGWDGTAWHGFAGGFTEQPGAFTTYAGQLVAAGANSGLGNNVGSGQPMGRIARWTGSQWLAIPSTLAGGFSADQVGLVVWNGKLVFGGSFTSINGVAANNVAQWNGTAWTPLGNGLDFIVGTLAVYNNDLYASGYFTHSGATVLPGHMARWNGTAWVAVGSGLDGGAYRMVPAGGKLYVTGPFNMAGGQAAHGIAAWDGTLWSTLGSGLGGDFGACIAPYFDGLFVGGPFFTAGDKSSTHIARWQFGATSAVEPPAGLPVAGREFSVSPPTPNPARGRATITFRIPNEGLVDAAVYDASGRRVQTLLGTRLAAGSHDVTWDGQDGDGRAVSSGVYWVRVATASGNVSAKVVWVR